MRIEGSFLFPDDSTEASIFLDLPVYIRQKEGIIDWKMRLEVNQLKMIVQAGGCFHIHDAKDRLRYVSGEAWCYSMAGSVTIDDGSIPDRLVEWLHERASILSHGNGNIIDQLYNMIQEDDKQPARVG